MGAMQSSSPSAGQRSLPEFQIQTQAPPHTYIRNPETDAGTQIKQKQIHADAKEIKDRYKIVAFPNTDRTKYILFVSDFLVSSKT